MYTTTSQHGHSKQIERTLFLCVIMTKAWFSLGFKQKQKHKCHFSRTYTKHGPRSMDHPCGPGPWTTSWTRSMDQACGLGPWTTPSCGPGPWITTNKFSKAYFTCQYNRVFPKEVGYAELALHPISQNVNIALHEHLLQQIINETNFFILFLLHEVARVCLYSTRLRFIRISSLHM